MDDAKRRSGHPKYLSGMYLVLEKLEECPNKECEWPEINTFLSDHYEGFNKPMRYDIKKRLIEENFVEFDKEKNTLKKLKDYYDKSVENAVANVSSDMVYNLRQNMIQYFINKHTDDIVDESENITFSVEEFSNYSINDLTKKLQKDIGEPLEQKQINIAQLIDWGIYDLIDMVENDPKSTIEIIEQAYEMAYYSIKNEKAKYKLNICGLPEALTKTQSGKPFAIEHINSQSIGKIVEFDGDIIMTSPIKSALKTGKYVCSQCGEIKNVTIENPFLAHFEPMCPKCGQEMTLNEDESEYINFQEIVVQQPLATMTNCDSEPKPLSVFIENQDPFYTGTVRITGIPIKIQKNKKVHLYDICVKSLNVSLIENEVNIKLEKEDIESIEKVVNELNNNSIAPAQYFGKKLMFDVFGYDDIKEAVLLQQIRGVPTIKNGKKRRHISHILLVGDPGSAKSQILRRIGSIPGNTYLSATTTSDVGLIASVSKTESKTDGGQYRVSIGPFPRANGGTCCVDEIGTNWKIQDVLLPPLEEMEAIIHKATIHTKVPTETANLAACNPKNGRFDKNISIFEQINMKPQFLSRYDMIYAITDKKDRKTDDNIIDSIMDLYSDSEEDLQNDEIAGVKIDEDFIVKYIMYARAKQTIHPKQGSKTDLAIRQLYKDFFGDMRKFETNVTHRIIESFVRISGTVAKSKLKDIVDESDAKDAIRIVKDAFKTIIIDPETGVFDWDRLSGDYDNEDRRLKNDIIDYIKKEYEKEDKLVMHEAIINELKTKYKDLKIEKMLEKLIKSNDIYSPKFKQYKIM